MTRLPIMELQNRNTEEKGLVYLPTEYGYLIRWDEAHSNSFFLYNRPARKLFQTNDFDQFISEMELLPNGTSMAAVNKCTLGYDSGAPQEVHQRIDSLIADKNFNLYNPGPGFLQCTCMHEVRLFTQ